MRHFAHDYNLDLRELVKYEKRGFGRGELITLVLISTVTAKPLKEYGKRRLNDKVPLKTFAQEAGLDYAVLHDAARKIKDEIEAKGEADLPAPLYDPTTIEEPRPLENTKKKKRGKK